MNTRLAACRRQRPSSPPLPTAGLIGFDSLRPEWATVASSLTQPLSCAGDVILFCQRPLQGLCLVPWCPHPDVALLLRGQDHRHGLRVDRFNDRVRRRRQEAIDEVGAELSPDAGEGEQRPVVIECEPDDILLAGVRGCASPLVKFD
jgi:hypothetical protein